MKTKEPKYREKSKGNNTKIKIQQKTPPFTGYKIIIFFSIY